MCCCLLLQVVVVHSFNCIEYPVLFLALNRLGAICSPSSPLFNPQELADQITLGKVRSSTNSTLSLRCLLALLTNQTNLRSARFPAALIQAKAVISHKMLAPVALAAAKLAGIPQSQTYTIAPGPGSFPVQSIECVSLFVPSKHSCSSQNGYSLLHHSPSML